MRKYENPNIKHNDIIRHFQAERISEFDDLTVEAKRARLLSLILSALVERLEVMTEVMDHAYIDLQNLVIEYRSSR